MTAEWQAERLRNRAEDHTAAKSVERQAWALLVKAIIDADADGMSKTRIAELSRVSRRGVYDILEKADRI